ncbi:MAG: GatB/YqeY domain-containing protein, partial [Bacteroidia bacterium]|nr:GatB/YqeY domain-containing protein [Bacteroidia bacterium]
MSIKEKVNNTIKDAMKAKDADKLRAYRSIKSAFMLLETSGEGVGEEDYLKAVIKMAKQRKDSIAIYDDQGRDDLSSVEKSELAFIEELLPKQLGEEEMRAAIQEIIKQTGASGMKDMGKVMGL